MSKHTPEPWELLDAEGDKEYLRIRGTVLGGRYKIANVLWPNYSESAREREAAETLANAERIIDCVNACAGIADPAAEIAELKRQRDELLAALNKYEEAFDGLFDRCGSNGVFNHWGSRIDCTKLNEAHELSSNATKGSAS